MPQIGILPLGASWSGVVPLLAQYLHQELRRPVFVTNQPLDTKYAFDSVRKQYYSTQLLAGLQQFITDPDDRILALVEFDLYIPIFTYVFGEAQLDGPAAIVSMFRLRPEFYGLPVNESLVHERVIKECTHELGHTFGLRHCNNYECVMHVSTYVEEIDLKTSQFCIVCQGQLFGAAYERLVAQK